MKKNLNPPLSRLSQIISHYLLKPTLFSMIVGCGLVLTLGAGCGGASQEADATSNSTREPTSDQVRRAATPHDEEEDGDSNAASGADVGPVDGDWIAKTVLCNGKPFEFSGTMVATIRNHQGTFKRMGMKSRFHKCTGSRASFNFIYDEQAQKVQGTCRSFRLFPTGCYNNFELEDVLYDYRFDGDHLKLETDTGFFCHAKERETTFFERQ